MGRVVAVIAASVASVFVTFIVWIYLGAMASGFAFGPAESVSFESREHLLERGFIDQGAHWPGSTVHLHRTEDGYLLERQWLGRREMWIEVSDDLVLDTAGYEDGPGQTMQIWIANIATLLLAIGLGFAIWRLLIRRRSHPWNGSQRLTLLL